MAGNGMLGSGIGRSVSPVELTRALPKAVGLRRARACILFLLPPSKSKFLQRHVVPATKIPDGAVPCY
ncbi:MAG: hypothetical protein JWM16_2742 [Verrucomicrobiales bacterium]|nr:hypothetical protein [Verrucomicrobiales bacterium]